MERKKSQDGFALIGAVLLSVALIILTMALVFWVQQESRVSVKHRKSTTAFHLAEAGVDRARWKLQESNDIWRDSGNGIPITFYNSDKAFDDIDGGEYAIKISSHPSNIEQRIVEGAGRDSSTKEVRKIYAIMERVKLNSAVYAAGRVEVKGNAQVHWGPIRSQDEIKLTAASAALGYPRMYSRDKIKEIDEDPAAPNTDNIQYWAYYDVPPRPAIDFEAMKASAIANVPSTYFPDGIDWKNAYPGSPDFDCKKDPCKGNEAAYLPLIDDNLIWYSEDDLKIDKNTYVRGTFIAMDKVRFDGDCMGEYTASPPTNAWMEYRKIDTAAADEWFGDAGGGPPSAVSTNFTWEIGGSRSAKDGANYGVCIRGFVYAKKDFDNKKDNVIHGGVLVDIKDASSDKDTIVFYDDEATENVVIMNARVEIVEWREQPGSWPAGL